MSTPPPSPSAKTAGASLSMSPLRHSPRVGDADIELADMEGPIAHASRVSPPRALKRGKTQLNEIFSTSAMLSDGDFFDPQEICDLVDSEGGEPIDTNMSNMAPWDEGVFDVERHDAVERDDDAASVDTVILEHTDTVIVEEPGALAPAVLAARVLTPLDAASQRTLEGQNQVNHLVIEKGCLLVTPLNVFVQPVAFLPDVVARNVVQQEPEWGPFKRHPFEHHVVPLTQPENMHMTGTPPQQPDSRDKVRCQCNPTHASRHDHAPRL